VASERATNRDDQYFSDDPHKLFDLDQPLVMHDLLEREGKIDPSNPYLKYPEEIKNQRLTGVLGFTKHDILYASTSRTNTTAPEIIDLEDAPNTKKCSGEVSIPAMTLREITLEDSESEESSTSELVDTDSESEEEKSTEKYSRLKKGKTPSGQRVETPRLQNEQTGQSVIDLTENASDEEPCRVVLKEIVSDSKRQNSISRKKTSLGTRQPENIDIQVLEDLIENSLSISDRKLSPTISPPLKGADQIQILRGCRPVGLTVLRPMTSNISEEYERLIALGQRCELSRDSGQAAKHYLSAIELCDEDIELHRKLSKLKSQLESTMESPQIVPK
jgi:hypothetical protein